MSTPTPARFGKYEVIEKIGQGGFGVVYRGRDPVLKRDVAIKTCSFQEDDLRRRFLREAEVSARLQHPNVVTIHDFGEQDGQPYMVQEFIEGEDMAGVISGRWTRSTATEIDWLVQAARGLEYAHRQGVVHRDVKPGNLRIQPDGRVRVLDFGIAKLLDSPEQLTRTGMSVGTASYLSPEQLAGKPVDHRADIFSFGSTAYELVTGRKPFAGDSLSAIIYNVAHEEPRPVTELEPDCAPALAAIIQRCLCKEPAERYQDFAQVIQGLEAALRGEMPDVTEGSPGSTASGRNTVAGTAAGTSGTIASPASGGRADGHASAPVGAGEAGSGTAGRSGEEGGVGAAAAGDAHTRTRRSWIGLGIAALLVAVVGVLGLARWGATVPGFADREGASAASADRDAGEPAAGDRSTPGELEGAGAAAAIAGDGAAGGVDAAGPAAAATAADPGAAASDATASDAAASGESGPGAGAGADPSDAGGTPAAPPTGAAAAEPRSGADAEDRAAPHDGAARAEPPTTDAALHDDRILVVLYGETGTGLEEAEAVLLEELGRRGLEVLEPTGLDLAGAPTGWDPAGIGSVARSGGAATVLLATLRTEATPSVPGFFTGRAVLDLRAYRTAGGSLLGAETLRVGSDTEPGELGPTATAARSAAAEVIGHRAVRWVVERVR